MFNALFIPTLNSGVQFWRFHNFVKSAHRNNLADFHHLWWQKKCLTLHDWQVDVLDPRYLWRITKEIQDWAFSADIIIFQMLWNSGGLGVFEGLRELLKDKNLNTPVLSECDDNMLSTPPYNSASAFYSPGGEMREVAVSQFRQSDAMIVSTPGLKELYSELNENVFVIPNCIDFSVWDKLNKKSRSGIRIGWAGGGNHHDDLKIIEPVMRRVCERHKEVRFILVHGATEAIKNLPYVDVTQKWVHIDAYPKMLATQDFDIGIAPLVDNAFNRCKSNLRWLECSALKIPTVASNVGHFKETIKNGVNGFLVGTEDEWVEALEKLITDRALRKSMGVAANDAVRKSFNVDIVAKEYVQILHDIVDKSKTRNVDDFFRKDNPNNLEAAPL